MECTICLNPFTSSLRKKVGCPYCRLEACLTCVKRYMLESPEDAHCMGCKRAWNRDFIDSYLTSAFRKGALKTHRETTLVDRERARLPLLQPRIEARVQANGLSDKIATVNQELRALELKAVQIRENVLRLHRRQGRLFQVAAGTLPIEQLDAEGGVKEVRTFTQKCPMEDCRGFLSSQWKCGTCQTWVCPDCLVPKGKERDAAHTCNEDAKATATLIRKETRPCPKCGEGISKVDGCFAKDTPILLWDGTIKMSQDIKIGDTLVGDDGDMRIVQETCTGQDELYEVTQAHGMSYMVNSKHTLVLKCNPAVSKSVTNSYSVRWFDETTLSMRSNTIPFNKEDSEIVFNQINDFANTLPSIFEIPVYTYIGLSDSVKKNLMGFKSKGVNWPKKDVRMDPYLLGLYLGDGIVDGISYAACPQKDPEILQYLLDWCEKNECELVHDAAYRFRIRRRGVEHGRLAIQHGATTAECKGCTELKCDFCDLPEKPYKSDAVKSDKNPYKTALASYSLLKNKHIPQDFIVNDRETRLQLLAGLVDTDGYLGTDGKRIEIPQSNHVLARQIEFLARSLGLTVHVNTVKKKNIRFAGGEAKDYPDHLKVNISGKGIHEIPCRVARKMCYSSNQREDGLSTNIQVNGVGRGTYFGWSINSNKRFVLPDMTTSHNCDQMWCITCKTPFSWSTGRMVFGVVHNPHYYQWLRQQNGGEAPRVAGDVPCGGVIGYYTLSQVTPLVNRREIEGIHRVTAELHDQILREYPRFDEVPDNGDLGIEYSLKIITMDEWKSKLWQRETKREKGLDLRGPLDLFANVSSEVLRRMANGVASEFLDLLNQLRALRTYVNEEIEKIGKRYSCTVPKITGCWRWDPHGGNRKELLDTRVYAEKIILLKPEILAGLDAVHKTAVNELISRYCIEQSPVDGVPSYAIEQHTIHSIHKTYKTLVSLFDANMILMREHAARCGTPVPVAAGAAV